MIPGSPMQLREAADVLGVHYQTAYLWVRRGSLAARKQGRDYEVDEADVRMLAITHISSRYSGRELRDEARAVFANTEAPRDFDAIEVPFPERGRARLVHWSGRKGGPQDAERSTTSAADAETVPSP